MDTQEEADSLNGFLGDFILVAAVAGVCLAEKAAKAKAEAESNDQSVESQPLMDGQNDPSPASIHQLSVPETIAGPSSRPSHSQNLRQAVQANQEEKVHQQPPVDADPNAIELGSIQRGRRARVVSFDNVHETLQDVPEERTPSSDVRAGKQAMR